MPQSRYVRMRALADARGREERAGEAPRWNFVANRSPIISASRVSIPISVTRNGSNLSCFNGEGMEGTTTGKGNRYLLWLRGARRYNDAHPAGKWNSCGFSREERRFVKIRGVSLSLRPAIPLSSFFLYAPATRIIVSSLYS